MPRIPPAQIDTLKRDVSIRAVLEARGIAFVKHGPDVACACPLGTHEDSTPSFIVSERKNLWRCHGCGEGGDVLKLVQVLHGVSFRHAVELLAAGVPSFAAGSAPAKPVKVGTRQLLPCPIDANASEASVSAQVVGYYAQRMNEPNNAARAYLASRGLDHADLLRRFSVGYADRTLGLRIPDKNRQEGAKLRATLAATGWFRESGHEHFAGSVVFPIHGADGAVVGAYGRKIIQNLRTGTPKHLYLSGQHRSLWNAGPGLVDGNGQVIICEAIMDAASCWVSGLHHVTAAYGIHGWTPDHDAALITGKARDAFVAFDADVPGDAAAVKLAEHLIGQGFTAYRVRWPAGLKDANDVLTDKNHGQEALRAAIASAEWLGGAPRITVPAMPAEPAAKEETPAIAQVLPSFAASPAPALASAPAPEPTHARAPDAIPGVQIEDRKDSVVIRIGSRTYIARGLERNTTADVLRVSLRVEIASFSSANRLHVDHLDLIQARQRAAFTRAASEETGLAADLVKSDLGHVLLALEHVQHARATAAAKPATPAAADPASLVTPEIHDAALALLKRPDLLDVIASDLGHCGLIGETPNKKAAMLACTSRLLPSPLAVLVQSTSAAGKTTLMDAVLSFLPDEAVRKYSAISGRSPFYLGGGAGGTALKHRILAIAEEEGARRASYALKLLQSDGRLTMAATGKDPESGKLITHDYHVEGPVMLFLTTTAIDLDPELVNRCLVLSVDESPEQTQAIHHAQRQSVQLAGIEAAESRKRLCAVHQHAQRLLRTIHVIIPGADQLRFAAGSSRLRRDHVKFLTLIKAVTLLHQHQRTPKTHTTPNGTTLEYIEATPADIEQATALAGALLGRSLDDLPPQTRRLWDGLRDLVKSKAQASGGSLPPDRVVFTRREICAALGWSYKQVRTHLERLQEQDYLTPASTRIGEVSTWKIVPGIDDDRPASPVLAHTDGPGNTPMVGTLPGSALPCPDPAHSERARFSPDEMQAECIADGGLPTIPGITYRGGTSLRVASYPHASTTL